MTIANTHSSPQAQWLAGEKSKAHEIIRTNRAVNAQEAEIVAEFQFKRKNPYAPTVTGDRCSGFCPRLGHSGLLTREICTPLV
jgi:hypothetical protein